MGWMNRGKGYLGFSEDGGTQVAAIQAIPCHQSKLRSRKQALTAAV